MKDGRKVDDRLAALAEHERRSKMAEMAPDPPGNRLTVLMKKVEGLEAELRELAELAQAISAARLH